MIRKRFSTSRAVTRSRLSDEEVVCFYPRMPVPGDQRPWLLLVSPYHLYPVSHGGAVRIDGISRVLAKYYRLVLVCDEGWDFDPTNAEKLDQFESVHLLVNPRDHPPANRLDRMRGHARPLLCREILHALSVYRPAVVQIEYEELCGLVKLKRDEDWFITLHDVNRGDKKADNYLDRQLQRFDGVFCCSEEDQALLPSKSHLVENGTSLARVPKYQPSRGQTLLFTGPFRYPPNRIGMEMFAEEIFPQLVAQFPLLKLQVLCGDEGMPYSEQSPFTHPQIELLPHCSTVGQYLESATMTINPLLDIAGSCLKTIESLAANRVCVSTTDAARGLERRGFPGLLTVSSPEQFIESIKRLLKDESLRHRLEKTPPDLIRQFDWEKRAARQVVAYEI